MKILWWITQGCDNINTQRALKSIILEQHPDIIFLSETKSSPIILQDLITTSRYTYSQSVNPVHQAEGFLLLWNANIDLKITHSNKYIITTTITHRVHHGFSISFFYGKPYPHLKELSWNYLKNAGETANLPWMTITDLNMIISQSEKCGGLPYEESEGKLASDIILQLGLIDMSFIGEPYT
ncbi:Endonuclease/exonuclease/phosphatase [Thalictrum thalictroides]|uniref:Endonuclease/exonuclease/phosphatase n=1 Tax=Thalictrum thalictroides TaxID=46969 RepID=A0A7J6VJN4_THATH|nr:Endonuclease/exonuclease/phosphatase [Thalictrum thalictroides]